MPYIITVRDPIAGDQSKHVGEDGRLRYNADDSEVFPGATGVRSSKGSTHAVATIEEACAHIERELDAPNYDRFDRVSDTERERCRALNEAQSTVRHALGDAGGTVGPLPDGTVIEVRPTTWEHLAFRTSMKPEFVRVLNHGGDVDAFHVEMLDAFNAR